MLSTNTEALRAAIGGTRQMMHADEMDALVSVLVASGAVSKDIMADAIDALIGRLVAKARGQMETDFAVFPSEVFDRVRELSALVRSLRAAAQG